MRRLKQTEIYSMPIYEYRCESCGHELEAIQKLSEAALVKCPVCEKDTLKKRISAAGFRLKGGGWYETDFKSGKKRNVAGEEGGKTGSDSQSSESAGAAAKSETKSDSKTESKSETKSSSGTSAAKPEK